MKIARLERLRQLQREYHRAHQWRRSHGGLFIPHSYTNVKSDSLSYWDDVCLILNGRRIIVWWRHPRYVYSEAIQEKAWEEAGPSPRNNWLTEGGTKNYKRVGRSRKKLVNTTLRKPSPEQQQYYDLLNNISARLSADGIDLDIPISWKCERLNWAMGVNLVAPLEVRNESDLALGPIWPNASFLGKLH